MSINKTKVGDFEYYVGQRVAAQAGTKGLWFYGFIEKLSTGMAKVRFDLGAPSHKVKDVKLTAVVPVINWKLDVRGKSFGDLEITSLPPHKTITREPMTLNTHFIYGMWQYANTFGFNGNLKKPIIKFSNSPKTMGTCNLDGTVGKPSVLTISSINKSVRNYFEVLVHEMVHQYNFEIDWSNPTYRQALLKDFHGSPFQRFSGPLKTALGVNVNTYADLDDIQHSVELDKEELEKSKAKELFYYVIHFPLQDNSKPVYVGAAFKNKDVAEEFYLLVQRTNYRQQVFKYILKRLLWEVEGKPSFYELTYDEKPDIENITAYDSTLTICKTNTMALKKVMQTIPKVVNVNSVIAKSFAISPKNLQMIDSTEIAEMTYNGIQKPWRLS